MIIVLTVLAMVVVTVGGIALIIVRSGNLHSVLSKQVFRSATLSAHQLVQVVNADHIKTIINLRGQHDNLAWYRDEIKVANQYHIQHIDLPMGAYVLPKLKIFHRLIKILLNLHSPSLIHCQSGSDRTGLVSAIILLLHNDRYAIAMKQINWRYGVIHANSVGYLVLPKYKHWLHVHHWQSSRERFLTWAAQVVW